MAKKSAPKVKESFKLVQKRNGRWAVKGTNGKYINGEEKVKILATKGVIKVLKKKAGAPAAEAPAAE
ncbi:MAG: hypothetical protein WCL28_08600 [bacterium]|jgi:hypothetical protein